MVRFNKSHFEMFLGVARKYMQLRGGLNQKDIAEMTNTGISTMSRFLNQKAREIDDQLVARIVAVLEIPLYEIIDFIDEDSTEQFKRLVKFYGDELAGATGTSSGEVAGGGEDSVNDEFENALRGKEQTRTHTTAQVKIGGRQRSIPFGERPTVGEGELSLRDKLEQLSPRQKAYLTDFLDLDGEGRDLIVDIGNSLFRYFKQARVDF